MRPSTTPCTPSQRRRRKGSDDRDNPRFDLNPLPRWQGVLSFGIHPQDLLAVPALSRVSLKGNFRARFVAVTAFDADGKRIFGDEDVEAIGELPSSDIRKLFDVAAKLNGMSKEDEQELEKNS